MSPVHDEVLSPRALNRATLDRQQLLSRASVPAATMLEHLVGMQAQAPHAPYVGLWSRLAHFDAGGLSAQVFDGAVVRAPLMRATVHLVTAGDFGTLCHWLRPMLQRSFAASPYAKQLVGVDLSELAAASAELVYERPMTRTEIGAELSNRWPGRDTLALGYAATSMVPLIQAPPRGIWGVGGPVRWVSGPGPRDAARALPGRSTRWYSGTSARSGPPVPATCRRGRGSTGSRTSCGASARLRRFRDMAGRELFDLPEAPRPDPATPAPPRFLPEYDNLFFGYHDRTRIWSTGQLVPLPPGNGGRRGTLLVDGLFQGTWAVTSAGPRAVLEVTPFQPFSRRHAQSVIAEGHRLLSFVAPDCADAAVVFTPM